MKNKLDTFKDYKDRIVLDVYPRRFEKPLGTIVLVEGDDNGKDWTLEEFHGLVRRE